MDKRMLRVRVRGNAHSRVKVGGLGRLGRSGPFSRSTVSTESCRPDCLVPDLGNDMGDTSTPEGRAMFQMTGVFAEFERAMIQQRINAGLSVVKEKLARDGRFKTRGGKVRTRLGRPGAKPEKIKAARQELAKGTGIGKTARLVGLGTGTVHKQAGDGGFLRGLFVRLPSEILREPRRASSSALCQLLTRAMQQEPFADLEALRPLGPPTSMLLRCSRRRRHPTAAERRGDYSGVSAIGWRPGRPCHLCGRQLLLLRLRSLGRLLGTARHRHVPGADV